MRFLITGGAGFIGSHLANHLHQMGHYVRVLDDMSSGDPAHLHPDIFVKRGDVRDVPSIWSLLHGVDIVYHLAARVSVPASILYPREYNDVNVGGTVALLEACRDVGVGRVVLASSATVYGRQEKQPIHEEAPSRPAVPYAVSKMAAEHYLFTMGQLEGFETVSLRIFNAYGPGQALPPTHAPVIPYVMQQVVQNASVVIYGDGNQTRDFVYIDDVVAALTAAAVAPHIDRQTINVGSGEETSINDLAFLIGDVVGKKARLLHNQEVGSGVDRLVADVSKAEVLLDFRPKVSLKKGLQNLYKQDPIFRKNDGTNSSQLLKFLVKHDGG
jgi:UDP-glucose 4-epimerase